MRFALAFAVSLFCGLCRAQDAPDEASCFWVGPYDGRSAETNRAFPDLGARYWSARFDLPEGASLQLHGEFPRARYLSFVSYNSLKVPTDSLYDAQIEAAGAGSDSAAPARAYVLEVQPGAAPDARRAPNTLYAHARYDGDIVLIYRVYLPEPGPAGQDGAGLPQPALTMPGGEILRGEAACAALDVQRERLASASGSSWLYRLSRGQPWRAETFPARPVPQWRAFYNPLYFWRCTYLGWCAGQPERRGGVYSNPQNAYVTLLANRRLGRLLVLQGRLPQTPPPQAAPTGDEALRYWSICSNETHSQRVVDCIDDSTLPLAQDRLYTLVVSRPEDRPSNARDDCGVAWLNWPEAGDGAGHEDDMLLILRNMLPAPDFEFAVQRTRQPGDAPAVMQEYLPQAQYMSPGEFELLGCG